MSGKLFKPALVTHQFQTCHMLTNDVVPGLCISIMMISLVMVISICALYTASSYVYQMDVDSSQEGGMTCIQPNSMEAKKGGVFFFYQQ